MKLLLLCLGLTLVCADYEENHEVVRSNFDMSKLSGFWYTILLASDVKEKIEEKGSFRLFLEYVRAFGNNSLFLKYHKKANGECTELNAVSHETVEEGVYSINYDGYTMFHIVEAVYDDYFIFYNLNSNEEETTQVLEFSARDPDVSPQLKKRFEELCQQFGIPKENVVDLTNDDRCIQARWSYGAQASRYIVGLYSSVSKYGWQKARIYSSAV